MSFLTSDVEVRKVPKIKEWLTFLDNKGVFRLGSKFPDGIPKNVPKTISNLKTKETRDTRTTEWCIDQEDKNAIEKTRLKTKASDDMALSWWTGQIVCISNRFLHAKEPVSFCGGDERKILVDFFTYLLELDKKYREWGVIGKSYNDYDYGMIVGRALVHNIGLTHHFRRHKRITDIDEMFAYRQSSSQTGKLDYYAWGLGISPKLAHGSEVHTWALNNEYDRIQEYCEDDIRIESELVARYSKGFNPTDHIQ